MEQALANLLYNNALKEQEILDVRLQAAQAELERQQILLARAKRGE